MRTFTKELIQDFLREPLDLTISPGRCYPISPVYFYDDSDDKDPEMTSKLSLIKSEFDRTLVSVLKKAGLLE